MCLILADIVAMFDQDEYFVSEGAGQQEVCLSVTGLGSRSITLTVMSQFNDSATGN